MNHTILIVEDDQDILFLYSHKLQAKGFHVVTAQNGYDGLELCRTYSPDLVLVDLQMPIMDGLSMIKAMRASEDMAAIPVIILTNQDKSEAPHELRFLRIDSYIVKAHTTPIQLAEHIARTLK